MCFFSSCLPPPPPPAPPPPPPRLPFLGAAVLVWCLVTNHWQTMYMCGLTTWVYCCQCTTLICELWTDVSFSRCGRCWHLQSQHISRLCVCADCVYSRSSAGFGEGDAQAYCPAGTGNCASDSGGHKAHPRLQGYLLQSETGEDQWNHQCSDIESALQAGEW